MKDPDFIKSLPKKKGGASQEDMAFYGVGVKK